VLGCAGDRGACGKDHQTADLQDVLIHQVIGIAQYTGTASLSPVDALVDRLYLVGRPLR
jgi:hydroxylamine reductase